MNKTELFRKLSAKQKEEFEKDILTAIESLTESDKIQSRKFNRVRLHVRLENKIFLHVSMSIDRKGQIQKDNLDIIKFMNVDQFLDSLNEIKYKRKIC